MGVASKRADKKYLQDLVPLNALSESRFVQVARKIVIEEVRKGRYLFRKGNRDNESIYLLDGKINLIDGHRKVTSEVEAGTDVSRYPIANQQPRPLSARAVTRAVIARIDSGLLDVFLTWDQTSSTEVSEIGADDNKDWMTRILQSEAFIKIPPAIIQRLLLKMESVTVRAGKAVIKQGDEGDYFYTIHQGQCAVTRRENPDGDMLKLAELSEGDSFGEDALVSDARRNATVTMLSDGVLMRLAKKHFVELLQKHLISDIGYDAASTMVDSGAVWVDVRSSGEYTAGAFEDSVNIPLSDLRGELPELVFNVKYIICCDTGRRSSSAAFILSHKGYEVYVLDGGMNGLDEGFAAAADTTRDAGVTPEHDQPGADSVDIRDARESSDTDDQTSRFAEAPTGNAVPTANPAAEQLEEITELRRENTALRQAGIAHEDSVRNLAGREVDVERLENALREAQQQQQAELGEARREAAARLDDLVTTLHEQQQLAGQLRAEQDGLRAELQQSRQNTGELEAGIAAARDAEVADTTQHNSELDTLRGELELSRQENTILVDRRADADRGVDELRQQLSDMGTGKEAEREDQQQLNAALQQEVDAGSLARQELQQQLEALQETYNNDQERLNTTASEHETVSARLQETEQQHDALHAENHQLEVRNQELQEALDNAGAAAQAAEAALEGLQAESAGERGTLQQDIQDRQQAQTAMEQQLREVTAERDGIYKQFDESGQENTAQGQELDRLNERITELTAAANEQVRVVGEQLEDAQGRCAELQQQLEALQETYNNDQERLNTTASEHETVSARLQETEQQHDALHAENHQLEVRNQELQEALDNAGAAAQAAEAALEGLQAESAGERGTLQQDIQDRQQAQTAMEQQLLEVTAERDGIRKQFDESGQENTAQGQEIDRLNERITELTAAADEQVRVVGEQLEEEQGRFAELQQQYTGQAAQVTVLQKEIDQHAELQQELNQQVAVYEKQTGELQQELRAAEERSKTHDLDNQEALNKAYDDLNRKNDIEKEMQGQLERLRKKLEQTTNDLQEARDEARTSAGHFREELHAERRERAQERAELAARQKQLKEQLAAVANEHEEVLSSHKGVVAQARDDAREEERARREHEEAGLGQVEEQLAVLQEDLDQSHAEMAEAVQQERERNAADLALARGQKSEADTAIDQLETQLKQLTTERDAALGEQQATREQLNTLRVEVEVARGLMNAEAEAQLEDPEKLRAEIEESRRNVEIAVRLRTQAESQRDTAVLEVEALRAATGQGGEAITPLEVLPLGNKPPARPAAGVADARVDRHGTPPSPNVGQADKQAGKSGYGWQGTGIGLGVVAIAALVIWLLLQTGTLSTVEDAFLAHDEPAPVTVEAVTAAPVPAASSLPPDTVPPVAVIRAAVEPVAVTDPGEASVEVAVTQVAVEPVAAAESGWAGVEVVESAPSEAVALPAVAAMPALRDPLKGGGDGPLMVELPAAGFMMGSAESSMNFNERPQHRVVLRSFSISKTEVTFAGYDRFARATGRRLPYDEGWGRADQPVINVSWKDVSAYAAWLSEQTGHDYRLPTEAQWEFAAAAGSKRPHWWDDSVIEIPANCFDCGNRWDGRRTAAVGSFSANGFGLHDTAGNVQEWIEDCYHENYEGAATDGSAWQAPRCTQRVVRGGAYTSPINSLRSAKRGQYDHDTRLDNLGFRVVRSN